MNFFNSKTTISIVANSITHSRLRHSFILIPLVLACFALSPRVQAVVPAPDGGYPGNNTAEGDNALFNLVVSNISDNVNNTAVGYNALVGITFLGVGSYNTATGAFALYNN